MPSVACEVVRWVSDDPFPGWVEVRLVDTTGAAWTFEDKPSVFATESLSAATTYPVQGAIRCTVIDDQAGEAVVIDTSRPDGLASVDGSHQFSVRSDAVTR